MGSDPEETARTDFDNLTLIPGMWVKVGIQRLFFLTNIKCLLCQLLQVLALIVDVQNVQQGSNIL